MSRNILIPFAANTNALINWQTRETGGGTTVGGGEEKDIEKDWFL